MNKQEIIGQSMVFLLKVIVATFLGILVYKGVGAWII